MGLLSLNCFAIAYASSATPWVGFASSGMILVVVEEERDGTCRCAARDARLERGEQHD